MTPITLSARDLSPLSGVSSAPFVGRICTSPELPAALRGREILFLRGRPQALPAGFRGYLMDTEVEAGEARDVFVLGPSLRYLSEGDVVRIDPGRQRLSALYRRRSPSNALLVTERCDNYCLMCSQPPRERDDSWLVDELLEQVIPLLSPDTRQIGITGGEPALLGDRLVQVVGALLRQLPRTAVHILSNGRRFSDPELARALGRLDHPDLMVGVPIYADLPEEHDYVVQARGAFDEAVRGILQLKAARVRVEVRCVIHSQTWARLPELARFLARNLRFVDQVALMGLEQVGFARANLEALWVDPLDYHDALEAAVRTLQRAGMTVSLYNQPLCVLAPALHPIARKAISDWKNVYLDACDRCRLREACGGFFASSTERISRGIAPVL